MAVGFSGVASSVSISGAVSAGLPIPSASQTQIEFEGSTTAATVTIFTVPANTIYYITSVTLTSTSAAAGVNGKLIKDTKEILSAMLQKGTAGRQAQVHNIYPTPLKFAATETLQYTADDTAADYKVVGFSVAV